MLKIVPLTQIKAGRRAGTIVSAAGHALSVQDLPTVTNSYFLSYDPGRGILYAAQPDGSVVSTSGFETIYSIGTGVAGSFGLNGKDGNDGLDASNGAPGAQGLRGPIGPQGYQGPAGPQGPKGDPGGQGAYGEDGPTGNIGTQGKEGPIGPMGQVGYRGLDRDIYFVFSETQPAHDLLPGNVWYEIRVRNYSALNRASCGGTQPDAVSFIAKSITTQVAPSWKLLDLKAKDFGALRNLLSSSSTSQDTGEIKVLNFDGSESPVTLKSETTDRVWLNTGIPFHSQEPLLAKVYIDESLNVISNSEFCNIKALDTTGYTERLVYYDRIGNYPGIRLDQL